MSSLQVPLELCEEETPWLWSYIHWKLPVSEATYWALHFVFARGTLCVMWIFLRWQHFTFGSLKHVNELAAVCFTRCLFYELFVFFFLYWELYALKALCSLMIVLGACWARVLTHCEMYVFGPVCVGSSTHWEHCALESSLLCETYAFGRSTRKSCVGRDCNRGNTVQRAVIQPKCYAYLL